MPITFDCPCGRKFRTSDENAGRAATCPQCRSQLIVPAASVAAPGPPPLPPAAPADAPYSVQSEEVVPTPRRPAERSPYGPPRRPDPYGRDADYRRPYDDRDDAIRRVVRRPQPVRRGGMTNAGVLGGIAMMVGAVIWFFVGLALNFIFFYPPILFVIGLIAFIKGLASRGT